jgi:hypothetical protein
MLAQKSSSNEKPKGLSLAQTQQKGMSESQAKQLSAEMLTEMEQQQMMQQ